MKIVSMAILIALSGCASYQQTQTLNQEILSIDRQYCNNLDECMLKVRQSRYLITRYSDKKLESYDITRLDLVKQKLDMLDYEDRGFPTYCTDITDCKAKIAAGTEVLNNIQPPYENKAQSIREMHLKSMQEKLQSLKKTLAGYNYSKNLAKKPGVKIGMTAEQVIENSSWGKPNHVNRTTNSYGTREQWVYGSGNYLYFTNGVLTSIQN